MTEQTRSAIGLIALVVVAAVVWVFMAPVLARMSEGFEVRTDVYLQGQDAIDAAEANAETATIAFNVFPYVVVGLTVIALLWIMQPRERVYMGVG